MALPCSTIAQASAPTKSQIQEVRRRSAAQPPALLSHLVLASGFKVIAVFRSTTTCRRVGERKALRTHRSSLVRGGFGRFRLLFGSAPRDNLAPKRHTTAHPKRAGEAEASEASAASAASGPGPRRAAAGAWGSHRWHPKSSPPSCPHEALCRTAPSLTKRSAGQEPPPPR